MELEKIISDTRNLSNRLFAPEVLGPWTPCALVADLAGETGTLAHSVLTIEGIGATPPETAHLQLDIPRLLFMLVNLSNVYNIDLGQAWNDLMEQSWKRLEGWEQAPD